MKIGVMLSPFGESKPSGLGVFVRNLAITLAENNPHWDFTFFVRGKHDYLKEFDQYKNVHYSQLPDTFLWKDIACLRNGDIDVWLYINPSLPFFILPKKSIVTALDFGVLYPDRDITWLGFVKKKLGYLLQSRSLQRTTYVLCTSHATKSDVHKFFPEVPDGKVDVAMCGFTPVCEKYVPTAVNQLPDDYFLMVGVIKARKNQHTAVLAFIAAKKMGLKAKLVIAGKGEGVYYKSLLNLIDQSEYKNDIFLLGFVSNEQLVTLYKNARALVFPSHVEGFGMVLVEAMSCGVPVISSSNGAQGEVAEGYGITVDSNDISGFVHAMLALEVDATRINLVEKSKVRSRDFSWERTASVYREAIKMSVGESSDCMM